MPTDFLNELTAAQCQAVTHDRGPCLVIAGAGTGKTKVITHRIAYLISERQVPPEQIVALTFTDKAAREMEERVDRLLPYGVNGTIISTFHSFCADILKRHAFLIGVDPSAKLMSSADEISFLRQRLDLLPTKLYKPSKNPVEFLRSLINFLSHAKDECLTPLQIINHANQLSKEAGEPADVEQAAKLKELGDIYQVVEQLYKDESVLSYGDLINQVYYLLKNFPSVQKEEGSKIAYLLIDEFQDTNFVQNEVVRLLVGKQANIMAVGDDDQAIYSFRGANLNNILRFRDTYPTSQVISLTDNFRSTQAILDTAHQLIQYNNPNRLEVKENISKRLISHKPVGPKPEHWHFERGVFEQQKIATIITELLQSESYQPEDIAILVRSKSHAKGLETTLQSHNIPYNYSGDNKFYCLPVIQAALSFLRFLVNPDDDLNLFYCLSQKPFQVPERILQKYTNAARYQTLSLFDYLSSQDKLDPKMQAALNYLEEQLEGGGQQRPSQIFLHFLQASGLKGQLSEDNYAMELLASLHEEIGAYEAIHTNPTLGHYIHYIDYIIASDEEVSLHGNTDFTPQGVQIMTIHKSKGLEFSVVFIMNLVQGRFPGQNRGESLPFPYELTTMNLPSKQINLEEERRLAYVAFTRAKERLYLTSSEFYEERKTPAKLSPFVSEALGESAPLTPVDNSSLLSKAIIPPPMHDPAAEPLPIRFSPSALDTYIQCPKQYEYQHVLRVKVPASHFINFGISIHETLKKWGEAFRQGSPFDLEKTFQESWVSGGYENKQFEKERYSDGLSKLKEYISSVPRDSLKLVALEQSCRVILENGLTLNGKIDRIDLLPTGGYKVLDYKTSEKPKQAKELVEDIPLGTYALSLIQAGRDIQEVEINYIMIGESVTLKKEELALTSIQETIDQTISQIRSDFQNHNFVAKPAMQKCNYCDYKSICPFRYGS